MSIPVADDMPHVLPLFAGLTFGWQNRLQLLFNSYPSTDHARYIAKETQRAQALGQPPMAGLSLMLIHTGSKDLALKMRGRAYEVAEPAMVRSGLAALNKVRELKSSWYEMLDPIQLEPRNRLDRPRALYAVDIHSATTQGERCEQGLHVDEGRPVIDLDRLRGFDQLPALTPGQEPPRNKQELLLHLGLSAVGFTTRYPRYGEPATLDI